ncbi:hypothetical protein [Myroides odoratus]|uniref:hypothetical protein n=1 Tax=Myroides odoratus TaxID=256 RepID=UPI000765F7D7|nr:hypothetical protein [Myroides odoratus]
MRLKKKHKIIGGIFILIVVVYCSGQWIINYVLNQYLPTIIAEKNDSPYDLTYQSVHYSIAERKLTIQDIDIQPKATTVTDTLSYLKGKLKQIEIQHVALWDLIKRHHLAAQGITIIQPDIQLFQHQTAKDTTPTPPLQFIQAIDIKTIAVKQAHVLIHDVEKNLRLHEVHNFSAQLKGIHFGVETQDKPIPFTYKDYIISCDSVRSLVSDSQQLTIHGIQVNPTQISTTRLLLQPLTTVKDKADLPHRLLTIDTPSLVLKGTDWGYKNQEDFYLHIDQIQTPAVDVVVEENTLSTRKKEIKTSVNPKLLPFDLTIAAIDMDSITINSLNQWLIKRGSLHLKRVVNKAKEELHIGAIQVLQPDIHLHQSQQKAKPKTQKVDVFFDDLVQIDTLSLQQGSFTSTKGKDRTVVLQTKGVQASIEQIHLDAQTLAYKIPVRYKEISFSAEAIQWNTGRFYDIKIDKIQGHNTTLTCSNLELTPKYNRKTMVRMFTYADDIFTVKTKAITLSNYTWGFDPQDVLFFKADHVRLDHINANIFRDKTPTFNMSIKPLFSKKLRDIPFTLELKKVDIVNSTLEYEEYDQKAVAPGKLTFGNFNASIQHVYSGYKQTKLPTTTLAIQASFMNAAPLQVNWSFNVLNRSDDFRISGTIKNFPATAMQSFLQPYVKASTEGNLDLVKFNFTGNNKVATGTFGMNYKDLKVTLYRKNGEKKRKILSKIGNWFIHKNSAGEFKEVEIKKVNRIEEKSFFNYLWLCILQGLKQTIL